MFFVMKSQQKLFYRTSPGAYDDVITPSMHNVARSDIT